MRIALLCLAACSSDPNGSAPPIPLAVGATASIWFQPDLCAGPVGEGGLNVYTCSNDAVRSINSATAGAPFEIVNASPREIDFKANGPGDAAIDLDYINGDGERHEVSYPVKARAVERVVVTPDLYCPTPRVLSGEDFIADFTPLGTDAGKETPLMPGAFPAPAFTNATLVDDPLHPGVVRARAGTPGMARIASSLPGESLDVEVADASRAIVSLVSDDAVPRYYDIRIEVKASVDGSGVCFPPHGPWTLSVAPHDVCALTRTVTGIEADFTRVVEDLVPMAVVNVVALQGLGTCTVTLTHATLPLSATKNITVCAAGC